MPAAVSLSSNFGIIGQTFNRLTVLHPRPDRSQCGAVYYECRCQCGRNTRATSTMLKSGKKKSCGCAWKDNLKGYPKKLRERNQRVFISLDGQTFGYWTVLKRVDNDSRGQAVFLCRCVCGVTRPVKSLNLRKGKTRSCGCQPRRRLDIE